MSRDRCLEILRNWQHATQMEKNSVLAILRDPLGTRAAALTSGNFLPEDAVLTLSAANGASVVGADGMVHGVATRTHEITLHPRLKPLKIPHAFILSVDTRQDPLAIDCELDVRALPMWQIFLGALGGVGALIYWMFGGSRPAKAKLK